jgi:hypothetical protein
VFNENWAEYLSGLGDREFVSMLLGTATASVIEHYAGKRAGTCRLP